MAIFYQHQINETTRLGIWKIEEPESFFLEKVPLKRDVSHPHKRLQHLAGRYLLPYLFEDFPLSEILIADTRKPFLLNETYHFSISHCGDFAAAIVSSTNRVGIDIELVTDKVERIRHKFLNDFEWQVVLDNEDQKLGNGRLLTTLWSSKEAIFKWYSLGEVDFRKNMYLNLNLDAHDGRIKKDSKGLIKIPFLFDKRLAIPLDVEARIFDDLVLAYVVS